MDGRLARGERARRKVAEALVELLTEGDPEPTAKAIAARAGVSLRLVFHHFVDLDDLYRAVATLQLERHWSTLPEVSPRVNRASRITRTVRNRSVLYEAISPVRRAAVRRSGSSPEITAGLTLTNLLLFENLAATFANELEVLPERARYELLAAIDLATSWEVWERMRHVSGHSVAVSKGIMARTLDAILAA
jgi:TetR/AcrR family transcriptional regulator of autoinduction and epiphytic fitness